SAAATRLAPSRPAQPAGDSGKSHDRCAPARALARARRRALLIGCGLRALPWRPLAGPARVATSDGGLTAHECFVHSRADAAASELALEQSPYPRVFVRVLDLATAFLHRLVHPLECLALVEGGRVAHAAERDREVARRLGPRV